MNYLMRTYAAQHNKILFDIADIECWDTLGQRLTNANGWEVAFSGYCGEAPPGPACHPNWTGSIILGKAFWYMMTVIGGWIPQQPNNVGELLPLPFVTVSPNPFSGQTSMTVSLQQSELLTLTIFDIYGRLVMQAVKEKAFSPGKHCIDIKLSPEQPGIYVYVLQTTTSTLTGKLLYK
jgi:hypothetical protein